MRGKWPYILILGSGIISLIIFLIQLSLVFINCHSIPIYDLLIPGNKNPCLIIKGTNMINDSKNIIPWRFVLQNNGWPNKHYISNFLITFFTSSVILYSKKRVKKINLRYYIYVIAFTVMKGVIGEMVEAFILVCLNTLSYISKDEDFKFSLSWFVAYWKESIGDIFFSDMAISFLAGILATFYIYLGLVKPISILIFFKKWYILVLRTVIFSLILLSQFIIAGKKDFGNGFEFPLGLFAFMFLQWFFYTILWVEDRINSNKTDKCSEKDVDWFYIFVGIFMFVMWWSIGFFYLSGLLFSNIASVSLFFIIWTVHFLLGKQQEMIIVF